MKMDLNVEELLEKISEKVKSFANTDLVIGEEFKIGEFTCKPVIKIGTGFGSGVGTGDPRKSKKKEGEGGGAGAGIGIVPMGFLVTKGDEISFISAEKKKGLDTLFEKVPDLVEKMADMKEKKAEKEENKKES